ncbi:Neuferricin [Galdieria sulphuraria]|nr:Neuferricin [Galdieria sulphuraria]
MTMDSGMLYIHCPFLSQYKNQRSLATHEVFAWFLKQRRCPVARKTPCRFVISSRFVEQEEQTERNKRVENFSVQTNLLETDSSENLKGFIKTRGCLIPDIPFVFWWSGDIYSLIEDEPSRHLFEFEGFNIGRMKRVDGGWRLLTRELAVYKDPNTHEILEQWKNPFTEEICEVVHVLNDPVNQEFLLKGPRGSFKAPIVRNGSDIFWHAEIFLKYPSPLKREMFPQGIQNDEYQSAELFQFYTKEEDLKRVDCPYSPSQFSWVRIGQWLPFMKMGDKSGRLLYHCRGKRLEKGYQDLSEQIRTFVERYYPEYMDAPTNYSTPNETSWTYFKKLLSRRGFPRADGTRAHETDCESPATVSTNDSKIFTLEQLNELDGSDPNKPIYISICGIVFDVTKGRRHYRKGETYHNLVGREASRAFLTGDLSESGLSDESIDLNSLTEEQRLDLQHWVEYFQSEYPQVGFLDNWQSHFSGRRK